MYLNTQCIRCGYCVRVCPTNAISQNEVYTKPSRERLTITTKVTNENAPVIKKRKAAEAAKAAGGASRPPRRNRRERRGRKRRRARRPVFSFTFLYFSMFEMNVGRPQRVRSPVLLPTYF